MIHRASWLLLLPILAPVVPDPKLLRQERTDSVREVRDVAYYPGPDADPIKHKLDLYLPANAKDVPMLMWIHGGGWCLGDRSWFGDLGRRFAEAGIGVAIISYRLSPAVQHPAHVQDCARAFAWLREHAAEYGGNPDRLFVSGQSAGGHLSALLALDNRYLRELGVPDDAIKGSIPMSGVYTIPALPQGTKGLLAMFPAAFGSDRAVCRDASPASHVARLSSPMLVITETEDPGVVRLYAHLFRKAADRDGVKGIRFLDAEKRNHFNIVLGLGSKAEDPSRSAMVDFIRERCRELDRKD
jgi:acetyl esterase/lipase